jgi:hypothetical protein
MRVHGRLNLSSFQMVYKPIEWGRSLSSKLGDLGLTFCSDNANVQAAPGIQDHNSALTSSGINAMGSQAFEPFKFPEGVQDHIME